MRLPGDKLPPYEELLERVEKLEQRGGVTLDDLPLAQLQDKLERDWLPNPALLLGNPAIIASALGESKLRVGAGSIGCFTPTATINSSVGLTSVTYQSAGRCRLVFPVNTVSASQLWIVGNVSDNAPWHVDFATFASTPAAVDVYIHSTTGVLTDRTFSFIYLARAV